MQFTIYIYGNKMGRHNRDHILTIPVEIPTSLNFSPFRVFQKIAVTVTHHVSHMGLSENRVYSQ